MRSLKELYQILLSQCLIKNPYGGLCATMSNLWIEDLITQQEHIILYRHFKSQKPTWYRNRKFWKHSLYQGNVWWWPIGHVEQRILFIRRMIKKTSH